MLSAGVTHACQATPAVPGHLGANPEPNVTQPTVWVGSVTLPSAGGPNLRAMWLAHVICSGAECPEELEVVIDDLSELDRLNCDCGYGFALLSLSEVELVEL